jgi:lipoprotein-anchoring transpeptidase ErfK/SrfK
MALGLSLTSIHMVAAARMASLRRQQEQMEQAAITSHRPTPSQDLFSTGQKSASPTQEQQPSQPIAGQSSLTQQTAHKRQIIISIADRKLALIEDGQVVKTYAIAVGAKHTPSPEGDFVIVNRAKDPVYRHGEKEVAPGKDNPLGTRWMGLSMKGYGIHGTNVQSSVGKAASHGCFRMRKQDVEELYILVQVGDAVTVRRERDATIAQVFAAPANAPAVTLAKAESNTETSVPAAVVTSVETTQE